MMALSKSMMPVLQFAGLAVFFGFLAACQAQAEQPVQSDALQSNMGAICPDTSGVTESVPSHLGVQNGQLAPLPDSPNAISTQTDVEKRHVKALPMLGSLEETQVRILKTLVEMQRNTVVRCGPGYIHAVFVSPILRFRDDVEVFIDEKNALVHFRSASRNGYWDLGANRKRYEVFRKLYLR